MSEYFEDFRVGVYLKAHRERMGITRSDILTASDTIAESSLHFVEVAQRPTLELVERHHRALLNAYTAARGDVEISKARREQWYLTEDDHRLWQDALQANTRVSWWWGIRSDSPPRGAWCHLCDQMIHGYDVGRGMSTRARKAVMRHRLEHIKTLQHTESTPMKGSTK